MLGRNVQYLPPLKVSSWRKVAIGTWHSAGDPSVYGIAELPVEPALKYIEARQKNGDRVTLTHFMGRAIAEVISRHPDVNSTLRFGRLYPRKSIDIFFQVASDDAGVDLSGMTVRQAESKTVESIAKEMRDRVKKIRSREDKSYSRMKGMMGFFPGWMSGPLVNWVGWFMYALNIWSPLFGVPRDSFGSVMVTNIGSLGLDLVFAPLVPYCRVPLLIAMGRVREVPVVRDGEVTIEKQIRLGITVDHRIIDGMHASHMAKTLAKVMADPEHELHAS